jgi:DNA polymerase elongation subunit (family B)
LSRELDEYHTPSPAARTAAQLMEIGRNLRPGQSVRLLHLRGEPNVRAWDLPVAPDPAEIDLAQYRKLLLEAVETILGPIEESEKLFPYQIQLNDVIASRPERRIVLAMTDANEGMLVSR